MSGMELVKRKASRRGYFAAASVIVTILLFVFAGPFLGLLGTGASAFLIWRWFKFRAKWGLRF